MRDAVVGLFRLADEERLEIKTTVTLFGLHFLVLIFVQAGIQFYGGAWMNPWCSIFGLVWEVLFIFFLWMRGGWTLDLLVAGFLATESQLCEGAIRVIVGFLAVESVISMIFAVCPFYEYPTSFWLLAISTGSFFLFRFMNRDAISWNFAWFPAAHMIFSILCCVVAGLKDWLS